MKATSIFFIILLSTCCAWGQAGSSFQKKWLNRSIDFSQIRQEVNTYHMVDSTGAKVGSMVFGFAFENGFLVARDTSLFDNGSVYETAAFTFDTADFRMNKISIDMKTQKAALDIDLKQVGNRVQGTYVLTRDLTPKTFEIDSAYQITNFRGEIYMLTHALLMKPNDLITLRSLVPTSMKVSSGTLVHSGTETIETMSGNESCDVFWLKADGAMPDNKIWVRRQSPRVIVRFYIPGAELNIVLKDQKRLGDH